VQDVFQGRIFRTRGGAVLIGGVAAVLAAILLIVYLHSYRSSINSGTRPETVLVAKSLIPRGTSGTLIAQEGLYQVTTVPKDQLKDLAIVDPGALNDRVTAVDVYPGQQLTAQDFTTEGLYSIPNEITGNKRAIAIPVDGVHGLVGQLQAGDRVDVYVGMNSQGSSATGGAAAAALIKLLASNVLVLSAPTAASGGGTLGGGSTASGSAVLRVTTADAGKFAFAADNGRLWLILRPQVGGKSTPATIVNSASLLAAAPTVGG
jgi:Flp pilus assembly protein CpaB